MKIESVYFKENELVCRCCGDLKVDMSSLAMMDSLRVYFNSPIIVHSFYRCENHNKKIGGVKNSFHLLGAAMDFHILDYTMMELRGACMTLWRNKKILTGGIGLYENFIHVDTGPYRLWDNRRKDNGKKS